MDIPSAPSSFDGDRVEEFISQELYKLSLSDRNAIQEEIHGVRCLAPKESPDLLQKSLDAFQAALLTLTDSQRQAYDRCQAIAQAGTEPRHNYAIHDQTFRLRFLRCELFDAQRAAVRYTSYLNFVHELWGQVALEREIKFSDLNKTEAKLFRRGSYQILPVRDQSGRRVIVGLERMSDLPEYDQTTKFKVMFYLWNSIVSRDAESQQKGAVILIDIAHWRRSRDYRLPSGAIDLLKKLFAAVPTRIAAWHVCLPDRPFARVLQGIFAMNVTGHFQRLRFKFHIQKDTHGGTGGELYLRYQLKGYGIPVELMPFTESGTITTKVHTQWINARKFFESEGRSGDDGSAILRIPNQPPRSVVDCPGSNDVLFRQGKTMMEHPGNVMFRNLIMTYLEEEEDWKARSSSNSNDENIAAFEAGKIGYGKHRFLNSFILDEIRERRKGRFLEWDREKTVWTVLTNASLIKGKVSIIFSKARKLREGGPSPSPSKPRSRRRRRRTSTPTSDSSDQAYQFVEGGKPAAEDSCCQPSPSPVPSADFPFQMTEDLVSPVVTTSMGTTSPMAKDINESDVPPSVKTSNRKRSRDALPRSNSSPDLSSKPDRNRAKSM